MLLPKESLLHEHERCDNATVMSFTAKPFLMYSVQTCGHHVLFCVFFVLVVRFFCLGPDHHDSRSVATLLQTLVKPTVAKAFLASMQDLNVTLLSTTCNFIRCIKPNAAMQCGVFSNR